MTSVKRLLFPLAMELAFWAHLNRGYFDRYPYMYSPAQLAFLCECVSAARAVDGSIVEVGCAYGDTTVFLNRHMTASGFDRPYVCVDTFAGFVDRDVDYEVTRRGKSASSFTSFAQNKKKWFERRMEVNGCDRVTAFEADAAEFDFTPIAPIAFCLVDVDLYLVSKAVLDRVFAQMSSGATLVVDDCWSSRHVFDGAAQAYGEFVDLRGFEHLVVLDKLGVVRKP